MTWNETVRYAVLNFLAPRQVAAFDARQIMNRLNAEGSTDVPLKLIEVESACAYLEGAKLIEGLSEKMGSTKYWKATSEGVNASERWRDAKGIV
jgi:hypothetical protein